jgi:hypothetical protein
MANTKTFDCSAALWAPAHKRPGSDFGAATGKDIGTDRVPLEVHLWEGIGRLRSTSR